MQVRKVAMIVISRVILNTKGSYSCTSFSTELLIMIRLEAEGKWHLIGIITGDNNMLLKASKE